MDLLELPDLVLHQVLSLLGPLDLLQLASTSKDWYNRIRNDDSLWIPHLKTYSHGIWDEIVKDVELLGDIRISDWFVHYGQRLMTHERSGIREISVGKEKWVQQCNQDLAFETAILARSFELHEDSRAPIGILIRRYLYNLQLFHRENPYVDFLAPLPDDVRSDLEHLGQARDRDLLSRRHKNLQSTYVALRNVLHNVNYESCDRISELFPQVYGICLEPLFACMASRVGPSSQYVVCQGAELAEKYQIWADSHFDAFFNHRGHEGLRKFCELMQSGCQTDVSSPMIQGQPEPERNCDVFVADCRKRIRQRINRIVHSALVPRSAPFTKICRVDLSDAQELGGNNPKQEMLSSVIVSDRAVLLVMQLVGKNRF